MLHVRFAMLLCVGLGAAGCDIGSPLEDHGTPVAWVDEQKLTRADLRIVSAIDEAEARRERIDRGIDELLVAREARRRGLGYTEEAVRRIAAVRRVAEIRERMILRDTLYDVLASEIAEVEISNEELRAEFELRRGNAKRRTLTLHVWPFATESLATRALESREGSPIVLGPMLARELMPTLRKAAKQLNEVGDRIVVADRDQWSVVELIDQQAGPVPQFENAREEMEKRIRERLADEAFEREVETLRARADIRLEPGVLESDVIWNSAAPEADPDALADMAEPSDPESP